MKKTKIVSFLIIIAIVVGIGVFLGKKAFQYLEAKYNKQNTINNKNSESNTLLSVAHANFDSNSSQNSQNISSSQAIKFQSSEISESVNTKSVISNQRLSKENNESVQSSSSSAKANNQINSNVNNPFKDYKGQLVAFAIGNGINVREGPSLDSKVIMKVGKGTRGHVLEQKDGWTKIKWDFNKKIGWTRDDLLVIGPKGIVNRLEDFEIINQAGKISSESTNAIAIATLSRVLQKAKPSQLSQVVSVAVAKPVLPEESVRNYFTKDNLPSFATIISDIGANVRSEPNRKSALLGKLPKGMVVKIKECKKVGKYNWFLVTYNNGKKEGWIREDNLKFH